MTNAVVIYSGGLDSYTLLNDVMRRYQPAQERVRALSFDYGQRHKKELMFARFNCQQYGLVHRVVNMSDLQFVLTGSALTQPDIEMPTGHYQAETMKLTVVPGRNTIMLAIAMGYAQAWAMAADHQPTEVYYGAHRGDHFIYPDCRPSFVSAMSDVFYATDDAHLVGLQAPFLHLSKTQIVRRGLEMELDYARSWTCYEGGERPCGACGACVERAEAFEQNGEVDPLLGPTENVTEK